MNNRPKDATAAETTEKQSLPMVNVARIGTKLASPVLIVRFPPRSSRLPNLRILSPSTELLDLWKGTRGIDADWKVYERRYWDEVATMCRGSETIRQGAKALIADGLETDLRGACLAFILRAAARSLGVSELTLCCFEPDADEHCHRKLIYDALPRAMRGLRS
jgi:hypothetical protein